MKKIYLLLTGTLFLLPLAARAEKITGTINYNPARMGVFDYLKVKDEAFARNYVKADVMSLRGISQDFVGQPDSSIQVGNMSGTGSISFPYATFSASTNNTLPGFGDYAASTASPNPAPTGTLNAQGGYVLVGTTDNIANGRKDSFIQKLNNVGKLRIYASYLLSTGVYVAGDVSADRPRYSFLQSGGEDSESAFDYGLVLGGINISHPPVQFNSKPKYVWGTVTLGNSKTAKVLMLQGTSIGTEPDLGCTNGTRYCPDGVTVNWKCESGKWVLKNYCPTVSPTEKYITYPAGCAVSWNYVEEGVSPCSGWCAGKPASMNNRSIGMSFCAFNEEAVTDAFPNYGIMYAGTDNGSNRCTPGQKCSWCTPGKIYALRDSSTVYCGSFCSGEGGGGEYDGSGAWCGFGSHQSRRINVQSVVIVQCVERTEPPQQGAQPDCSRADTNTYFGDKTPATHEMLEMSRY